MAAAGRQAMTQGELNWALWYACGEDNDVPRAVELLDRGAKTNALLGGRNALHEATMGGRLEIVKTLLGRGAVLESRTSWGPAPCSLRPSTTASRYAFSSSREERICTRWITSTKLP